MYDLHGPILALFNHAPVSVTLSAPRLRCYAHQATRCQLRLRLHAVWFLSILR
jgi:hypothetical protein